MNTSFHAFFNFLKLVLSWVPFVVFFFLIVVMFLTDFQNPVDEYFVRVVLRSCLVLLLATALAQVMVLTAITAVSYFHMSRVFGFFKEAFDFLCAAPIVDIGIFSVAIFLATPTFEEWVWIIAVLLLCPTQGYWLQFFKGPIRNLYNFGRFHQISPLRVHQVLSTFYVSSFMDYFFVVLKKHLMPLVFILVMMDFRIIVPRLVESGLSYQAFIMFISLIISLHLLSYKPEGT